MKLYEKVSKKMILKKIEKVNDTLTQTFSLIVYCECEKIQNLGMINNYVFGIHHGF